MIQNKGERILANTDITVNQQNMEELNRFNYLGNVRVIPNDGTRMKEIKAR